MDKTLINWAWKNKDNTMINFFIVISGIAILYIKFNNISFLEGCIVFLICSLVIFVVNVLYNLIKEDIGLGDALRLTFRKTIHKYLIIAVTDGLFLLVTNVVMSITTNNKIPDDQLVNLLPIYRIILWIVAIATLNFARKISKAIIYEFDLNNIDYNMEEFNAFFETHKIDEKSAVIDRKEIDNSFIEYLKDDIFELDSFRTIESLGITNDTEIRFYKTKKLNRIIEIIDKRDKANKMKKS